MDFIENHILNGLHITKNPKFIGKVWKDFESAYQERNIIIYGISEYVNFLWIRCNLEFNILAAIDNDVNKQKLLLKDFFDAYDLKEAAKIQIASKDILKQYNPNEVVILISSARYFNEIAQELEEENFNCYFSVLSMEYYFRCYMQKNNLPFETEEVFMSNYAKECTKKYPIQNNKIVFYMRTHISHEKYITEQLLSLHKNLDIVWIVNKINVKVPAGVRTVNEGNWKKYIYDMETAKVWVYGVPNVIGFIKREGQIYIQTKHWGSVTLKKFYLDAPSVSSVGKNKINWQKNGVMIDYIISGSEFDERSCRSGFNFTGKFLRFGSPRSDVMFHQEEYRKKVYEQLNLNLDDCTLLYAPTYRFRNGKGDDYDLAWQGLDFEMLLTSLKHRFGGTWKILLRLHPVIKINSKLIQHSDDVIDVSNYEDSQELASAADIMISDYSSIMFEPAYLFKPVFLFAPDKDDYQKNNFELLLDYDSLPFPISTNNEELSEQIKNFDEDKYKSDVKCFLGKYKVNEDGHAAERSAVFIANLMS